MQNKTMVIAAFIGVGLFGVAIATTAPRAQTPRAQKSLESEIARHARTMLDEGRKTLRYDTFGSEAFWGDALQLRCRPH